MKTLLDAECHARLLVRLRSLSAETRPRWGRLTAHGMLLHLSDQMRYALGDIRITPRPGVLSWPLIKPALMYWLPWPKGVKSAAELFATAPTTWNADLATLEALLARFVADKRRDAWPEHVSFGSMTRAAWGRFSHRHFDHHLRQFGV